MSQKREWAFIDRWAKKKKAVDYLGGKCYCCGEDDFRLLDFHHDDPREKDDIIANMKTLRWSRIKKEIEKCKLLCRNCHNEHHYSEKETRYKKTKTFALEHKELDKCERCGYSGKNYASLEFHHKGDDEKSFKISGFKASKNNIQELIDEIEKCEVLCSCCHLLEHTDKEMFDKNKDKIIEKANNLKEIQPKIDRQKVLKMYNEGMKQIEIARHFKASKGTISGIVKKLGLRR